MRMDKENEGLDRIVYKGVIPAILSEIKKCDDGDQTVDVTCAAIRMILDSYDKHFHTGRV